MRFKVQIVPKAVDNIVYSGFCSLVCSVCKLFKWCASKQRPFGPLKRNKLGTWLFFWMTPKKIAMYSLCMKISLTWITQESLGGLGTHYCLSSKSFKEIQA